ncbi:AraC family transcriptional regulator [Flavobacterium seoulense]|uniref:AraC family transcriptional regulator n=1 Tax=Flavobacterium seoulense TaxID=1492738 RepID=A0A066WP84_9FLAO|nr:AraC family transcriptional regulator [Flavobacterium seoulense]KDN55691.1 AraC family transcriptional regulator [Flavobacterium seoulense]
MQRFNSFHSINVFSLELDTWIYELHKHNFYELIFIEEGKGKHLLNEISFTYQKGDVFLLTPDDAHEFIIEEKTIFTYVKFTEQVFIEKLSQNKKTQWEESLKNVLTMNEFNIGSIIMNQQDNDNLFLILRVLKSEFTAKKTFGNEAVMELFGALMTIITRNLNESKNVQNRFSQDIEKLNNILTYLRINALDNNKMKVENIAQRFLMSPNYISIYIKKHTGISLQHHIIQLKLKTAEKLLMQQRFNINEIALKLGFNDASHFNKIFKKYKLVSPREFIENQLKKN